MQDVPAIDSVWQHTNGNLYTVLHIGNHAAPSERYPLFVVYRGVNGNVWVRRADDWHRSMKQVGS